ncbi:MAG: hypothetical protein AAGC60_25215 [Acidobacteriota bacterium]
MRGAGGTDGGIGRFVLGLAMFIGGGYLFLSSIYVGGGFGLGYSLFSFGWGSLTTGMVLIPFIFGVGLIFYRAKHPIGWLLAGGSLLALTFGIIQSLRLSLRPMNAFELLVILVLIFGGLGLFFSSFRDFGAE